MSRAYTEKLAQGVGKTIADIDQRVLVVIATFTNNHLGEHVFLHGSRINHSCTPNLEYAWNPAINQGTFHAIKRIMVEEELTISYIPCANWTKEKRALALQNWGFTCACPACENSTDARIDDEWRAKRGVQIASLDQEEEHGVSEDWTKEVPGYLQYCGKWTTDSRHTDERGVRVVSSVSRHGEDKYQE
jgi:hypothetical protein